jgi:hypothetical protein
VPDIEMNRRKFLASSAAVADSVGAPQSSIASILSASPSTAGLDINRPRFGANDRPCHDWSWNDWNAERDLDAEKGQTAWLQKKPCRLPENRAASSNCWQIPRAANLLSIPGAADLRHPKNARPTQPGAGGSIGWS